MKIASVMLAALTALLLITLVLSACSTSSGSDWTAEERSVIASLSLANLPPLPESPSNVYADDKNAANLGHALFFEPKLSSNGLVSCATCHDPEKDFTDGLALARGVGVMNRKAMSPVGTAYNAWFFWDGRKDSLWSQALGPLERAVEHDFTRGEVAQVIAQDYAASYQEVFGALPPLADPERFPARAGPLGDPAAQAAWAEMTPADREAVTRVFVNAGKALEAYERELKPQAGRFDTYAEAVARGDASGAEVLSTTELAGLKLFIGEAGCVGCHKGPRFTDDDFHNTGVPIVPGLPEDLGRETGLEEVKSDEFNCLSRYSDAAPSDCRALAGPELDADPVGTSLERAYKVPSLRNVVAHKPYMHAGQFPSLAEVLGHYNQAPAAPSGTSELQPLGLSKVQLAQLEAFLGTLSSETD